MIDQASNAFPFFCVQIETDYIFGACSVVKLHVIGRLLGWQDADSWKARNGDLQLASWPPPSRPPLLAQVYESPQSCIAL